MFMHFLFWKRFANFHFKNPLRGGGRGGGETIAFQKTFEDADCIFGEGG